ncbi:hypothetical protein Bhyg_05267 [Pseudolycoriella hygida]|uniref:Uncharacterized protein n=1 Tax=Pseudolycoriella hygida TaxID=35572 RepID=A0A9Q0NGT0_9DIPT|nr:hypothetical protein Bhyg_05267 [Pseudolycoriella hygida]
MAQSNQNNNDRNKYKYIQRIAVKVPTFWNDVPEIWLAQFESQIYDTRTIDDKFEFYAISQWTYMSSCVAKQLITSPASDEIANKSTSVSSNEFESDNIGYIIVI